jgi:hypothetical protein
MNISNLGLKSGVGSQLAWGIGIYGILVFQPFLAIWLIFKKSPGEIVYPYLACALPGVLFLLLISRLRQREAEGISAQRLARNWGMSGALFAIGTVVAVVYSGVSLGFMSHTNVLGGTTVSVILSGVIFYAGLHYMALDRISARGRRGRSKTSSLHKRTRREEGPC